MNKLSLILSSKIFRSLDLKSKYIQAEEDAFMYALKCWEFYKKTTELHFPSFCWVSRKPISLEGIRWKHGCKLEEVKFISDGHDIKYEETLPNLTNLATIIHQMLYSYPSCKN